MPPGDRSEIMTKILKIPFVVALVLVVVGGTIHWLAQPQRTTEQFVGNMYHERYEDAAGMIHAPSALNVETDGGLVIADQDGRSISVPKFQLPFIVGGHDGDHEHDFVMTALGPSTDGILHVQPVTMYLRIVGDEVAVVAMEN